jgi:hypothetical protein
MMIIKMSMFKMTSINQFQFEIKVLHSLKVALLAVNQMQGDSL